MDKWKIVDREILLESPWFNFVADRCITQDEHEIPHYYWFNYKEAVMILGTTDDGKVVMVEEYRHGVKEVLLEFPAGLVDDGENLAETAKRELMEETGYDAGEVEFIKTFYPAAAYSSQKLHLIFARGLKKAGEQQLEETEHIDVKLIEFDELRSLIENDTIKGSSGVAAIMLANEKRDWFVNKK